MDQHCTETPIHNSETLGQTLCGIAQSAELIAWLADEKSSIQAAASVILQSVEKARATIPPQSYKNETRSQEHVFKE